jgi:hypothetical protein
MPESEGGALAAGTSESNTTDATDKGVVGLIKFTLRRILSAVAARSLREEGMQAASVSHWQSGHRVDVGRHVCKMIPIQRYSLHLCANPTSSHPAPHAPCLAPQA